MCQKWFTNEPLLAHRFTMPYLVEKVHVFLWVTECTNVPKMADKYINGRALYVPLSKMCQKWHMNIPA